MKKNLINILLIFTIFFVKSDFIYAKDVQNPKKIPVLAYHHIITNDYIQKTNQQKNESILATEEFEKQMNYLHYNGFYVATIEELEKYLNNELVLPEKTVVITFDDGYLSNKTYAYPILKKYNQKAELFLITSLVDKPQQQFDEMRIQFLRREDLEDIKDVFNFSSHTNDMHRGVENNLPLFVTSSKEAVRNDLLLSKNIVNSRYLAYPSGCNNPLVIQELKNNAYTLAFTIAPGYVTKKTNKYKLPRFNISTQKVDFEGFKKIVNGKY